MTSEVTEIKMLGRTYHIKCQQQEMETLHTAAAYLEERVEKLQQQKHLSFIDAAILSALDICGQHISRHQTLPEVSQPTTTLSEGEMDKVGVLNDKVKAALSI